MHHKMTPSPEPSRNGSWGGPSLLYYPPSPQAKEFFLNLSGPYSLLFLAKFEDILLFKNKPSQKLSEQIRNGDLRPQGKSSELNAKKVN